MEGVFGDTVGEEDGGSLGAVTDECIDPSLR